MVSSKGVGIYYRNLIIDNDHFYFGANSQLGLTLFILTSIHHEPWTIFQRILILDACYTQEHNEKIIFMHLDFKKYILFTYTEDVQRDLKIVKNSFKYKCYFMLSQVLNLNSKDIMDLKLHRNFT